jgi:hypothetical protein
MTTPTASASLRFPVRARLATLRGVALVLVSLALAAGFVASTAQGPTPSAPASASRAS